MYGLFNLNCIVIARNEAIQFICIWGWIASFLAMTGLLPVPVARKRCIPHRFYLQEVLPRILLIPANGLR